MHEVQVAHERPVRYEAPTSMDAALSILAEHGEGARPIAGGTDLLLEIERGVRSGIEVLVDTTRIADLCEIVPTGDRLALGGGVTHNDVVTSRLAVERLRPLAQACWEIGSPALRNRATVAGNVITASPANDTISALLALDATITLASAAGTRQVPIGEFITGFRQTARRADELVTTVSPRLLSTGDRGIFVKLGLRRAQAISVVHLAVVASFEGDHVTSARIALGSIAPTVILVPGAAEALIGHTLDGDSIEAAVDAALGSIAPIDDLRATADYRTDTVATMIRRALGAIAAGTEGDAWPLAVPTLRTAGRDHRPPASSVTIEGTGTVTATLNGTEVAATCTAGETLLDWLRFHAHHQAGTPLSGTKEGCAEGECGACTVHVDGQAVLSCLVTAPSVDGSDLVTVEGLAGEHLHPIQRAFVDETAVQCGYCIPGFLMAGAALMEEDLILDRDTICSGLAGNLCRCTGYYRIIEAVRRAQRDIVEQTPAEVPA